VTIPERSARLLSGPERLQQMHFSFAAERVLAASIQLDVFSHLAAGKKTVEEVASAAAASPRGMRMLLDALVGFDLLTKKDGRYEPSPDAARYLVRESPDYMGAILEDDQLWNAWSHLADAVRTGKPTHSADQQAVGDDFFPVLIRTLHITNREPARRLAAKLVSPDAKRGLRILDIGSGSAVWSIAIAKLDAEARVTAFDSATVLDSTRRFVADDGLTAGFQFVPGDLRVAEFSPAAYDLALLGNIVHGENDVTARDLFARIFRSLAPGGRVAIIDMVPNDDRTGPPFPLLFALNMLVNTDEGATYTLGEYRAWLSAAGFSQVDTIDISSHSPVIVATKPAR
jgi:SAM-dependent methyltransferase